MKNDFGQGEYIGDGVYLSDDGYQLWLANGDHSNRVVALDQGVFTNLVQKGTIRFGVTLPTAAPTTDPVEFWYTNWRGEKAQRKAILRCLWWGSTEYHPEEQWFLKAFDTEKQQERDFALKDCDFTGIPPF